MIKKKDKNQSILEYLKSLQEEYFLAFLRYRIYPSPKQRDYYKRIMAFKKEKILDICKKNNDLPNIFTSSDQTYRVRVSVLGKKGFPTIKYRSDTERDELEFSDKVNYYAQGVDVRVDGVKGDGIGKIKKFHIVKDTVVVVFRDKEPTGEFNINRVIRIL